MQKVTLIGPAKIAADAFLPGDVVEVDDTILKQLIAAGAVNPEDLGSAAVVADGAAGPVSEIAGNIAAELTRQRDEALEQIKDVMAELILTQKERDDAQQAAASATAQVAALEAELGALKASPPPTAAAPQGKAKSEKG